MAKRSDFSLAKTIQATRVTKDVFPRKPPPPRPIDVRSKSELRDNQIMSDFDLGALQDVPSMTTVMDALHRGRRLRAKSAKAIEFQLEAEAMQNILRAQELADVRKLRRNAVHVVVDERSNSRFMSERSIDMEDENFLEPLDTLNREPKGFEQKSSTYWSNKR